MITSIRNESLHKDSSMFIFNVGPNSGKKGDRLETNFLKISFNIGYTLLIIPFRFKLKPDGSFVIHTNIIQQACCGIVHVLILYQYFTEIRKFQYENLSKEPRDYFKWFQRLVSFIYHFVLVKVLWKDKRKLHSIMQYLSIATDLPDYKTNKIQSKLVIGCICSTYIGIVIICQVFGYGIVDKAINCSPTWLYQRYVATARYNFFITSDKNWTFVPQLTDISNFDIFLTILTFLGYYFRNLFAYYSDGLILMACLTLWVNTMGLKKAIRLDILEHHGQTAYNNHHNTSVILRNYYAVQKLSLIINEAMSSIVLYFLLDSITYYSTHLNAMFIASDWLRRIRAGVLFINAIAILFVSGDICKQVDVMLEWLSIQNVSEKINQQRLVIIINEVRSHLIGISGNIFVLDYTTIFNVTSTLVTYFIICSQQDLTTDH